MNTSEWVAEFNTQLLDLDVLRGPSDEAPQVSRERQLVNLPDLGMKVLAAAKMAAGGNFLCATIEVEVNGVRDHCAVDPRGKFLTARAVAEARGRQEGRIVVREAICGALAPLCRLDHVWCDDDVREILTQVREALLAAQLKIKERIDE